jgi:hypothetical protein
MMNVLSGILVVAFGLFLIGLAALIALKPHEFGGRVMPSVVRRMRLFALVAFASGLVVFYGVSRAWQ